MDEHLYGTIDRFSKSDKQILLCHNNNTNRIPNDIIKSNIHQDMNKLTDDTYNEIISCASPHFHSFIFYDRDLFTFLNKVNILLKEKNLLGDEIDIITNYMRDNKENIISSQLLNGKDIRSIMDNINKRLLDINTTNKKIKGILDKLI